MQMKLALLLGTALALPIAAQAEINGAEVGFDYSTLADGKARDIHKGTLGGAIELGFGQFAVQADLAQRYYGLADWDGTTFTLHGIYHMNQDTAIGGFAGKDWLDHESVEYYGLEFGQKIGLVSLEGHALYADGENDDGFGLGVKGAYAFTDQFSLGGNFQHMSADSDLTRIGATAGYELIPGVKMDGEIGFADLAGRANKESYISLGIKATFGPNNGVTFGRRGLQEILPGY